jgi:hypothetical protein
MKLLSITNQTNERTRPFTGRHSNFVHLTLKCYSVPEVPIVFISYLSKYDTDDEVLLEHVLQGGPLLAGRLT